MLSVREIVGKGYDEFWNFKGRYRIVKGSRASKKSKTTALYYIVNLMKYSDANLLVIRKTFRTLKDSCFTELKWAINRLNVNQYWKVTESPLQIEYIPTGQKIYFRGLDDPLKVTSITVDYGYLCWLWIEEAYEVSSESDFNAIDESIRGEVSEFLFKQVTLTFNPWNEHHWIKKRFFDVFSECDCKCYNSADINSAEITSSDCDCKGVNSCKDILAITTNYLLNEYLDASDLALFENMKIQNPRRYQVAGLGNWGIVGGLVFENWVEKAFDFTEISTLPDVATAFGLDFGYTNDPSAFWCGLISVTSKTIWVFDEFYAKAMQADDIFNKINSMGFSKEKIVADSARPETIDRLRHLGLRRIESAKKGPDSVMAGIDYLQEFTIIIHPQCSNFITEISNYIWDKDNFGRKINIPVDDYNHLIDAMRYAVERFSKGNKFSW